MYQLPSRYSIWGAQTSAEIYRAPTAERAEAALAEFRRKYPKHQVVADVWERSWQQVIPFFDFPEEIRKIIYTTKAVEMGRSLHSGERRNSHPPLLLQQKPD